MAENFATGYAPRGWLDDPTSKVYLSAHGEAVKTTLALWRAGVKARFASKAPDDALPYIGDARQIPAAPSEAAAAYRARLLRSFEIHEYRTTKDAYKNALEPLGIDADVVAVTNDHENTLFPAIAPDEPWWSRLIVVVDSAGGPWTAPVWLDPDTWTDDEVWGVGGMTPADLTYLRHTFRAWKWAGAYPVALVIIFASYSLGEDWKAGGWEGDDKLAIIPLGHVWDWAPTVYLSDPDLWSEGDTWEDAFTFD